MTKQADKTYEITRVTLLKNQYEISFSKTNSKVLKVAGNIWFYDLTDRLYEGNMVWVRGSLVERLLAERYANWFHRCMIPYCIDDLCDWYTLIKHKFVSRKFASPICVMEEMF